ncbi:MAG TPA: hypothetical protein VHD32_14905 [Candidatus Didemnitutus sp.]|nr:hypothetical protein [Candidatus Didemnitutus sp.]
MSPEDAKLILQAYRPDGSDAADAAFAEALKLAKEDPALARWFEAQQAFDRAVATKIVSIAPPPGLRTAILAGARTESGTAVSWWLQPRWLAMAAGLLLVIFVGSLIRARRVSADEAPFLAFIANDAKHSETHGGKGEVTGELQAKLTQPTTRLGAPLAVNFDQLRVNGCRDISFAGHDVLEVCFNRDGKWFHCYIVRQADFPALAASTQPAVTDMASYKVATWTDSSHVFMVVSKVGEDALRRLL